MRHRSMGAAWIVLLRTDPATLRLRDGADATQGADGRLVSENGKLVKGHPGHWHPGQVHAGQVHPGQVHPAASASGASASGTGHAGKACPVGHQAGQVHPNRHHAGKACSVGHQCGASASGGGAFSAAARGGRPCPDSTGEAQQIPTPCDHPNCSEPGLYHAPRSRDRLQERYQFCLEHVRSYNRSWDYCRGMSRTEIERMIQDTAVWERRTWPVGFDDSEKFSAAARQRVHSFRFDGPDADGQFSPHHSVRLPPPSLEIREALEHMDLRWPVTLHEVKTQYKKLAKKLHPDRVGSGQGNTERLKCVNCAYSLLQVFLMKRETKV